LLREAGGRDDGVKKEGSWAEAGGIKEEEEAGTRMDRGANGWVMLKRRSEWNGRRLVRAVWWRRVGGRRGPEEVEEAERERLGGGEGKMDGRREEDDDAGQLRADAERGKGNGMRATAPFRSAGAVLVRNNEEVFNLLQKEFLDISVTME
jgi:hypothetical protein